jgi:hypothetical protein
LDQELVEVKIAVQVIVGRGRESGRNQRQKKRAGQGGRHVRSAVEGRDVAHVTEDTSTKC